MYAVGKCHIYTCQNKLINVISWDQIKTHNKKPSYRWTPKGEKSSSRLRSSQDVTEESILKTRTQWASQDWQCDVVHTGSCNLSLSSPEELDSEPSWHCLGDRCLLLSIWLYRVLKRFIPRWGRCLIYHTHHQARTVQLWSRLSNGFGLVCHCSL